MIKKTLLLFFSLLFISSFIFADLGPKPEVHIDVFYNNGEVYNNLIFSKMLTCRSTPFDLNFINGDFVKECLESYSNKFKYSYYDFNYELVCNNLYSLSTINDNDCYWTPERLARGGIGTEKLYYTYMLPQQFKLAVFIPDTNEFFVSNVVYRKEMYNEYKLYLSDVDARLNNVTPLFLGPKELFNENKFGAFIISLIITLVIELIVALIILLILRKFGWKIYLTSILVNLVSLPIVWFVFGFIRNIWLYFIFAELFAVIFESFIIYSFNKNKISFKQAILLSFIMNFFSCFWGFLLILWFI
jgi:hypothetical protein